SAAYATRIITRNLSITGLGTSLTVGMAVQVPANDNIDWAWATLDIQYQLLAPTLGTPSGDTASLTPTLNITHNIANQNGAQYEVRRVSDNVAMWNDGVWKTGSSVLYAGTTLVEGVTYKWRARSRNTNGGESEWSSYKEFRVWFQNPPTVTLTSPTSTPAT